MKIWRKIKHRWWRPTHRRYSCDTLPRARRLQRQVNLRMDSIITIQGVLAIIAAACFAGTWLVGYKISAGIWLYNVINCGVIVVKSLRAYRDLWWQLERLANLYELFPTTH